MGTPGKLVVLDLRFDKDRLVAELERVDNPHRDARLAWAVEGKPETDESMNVWEVGGGAAFIISPSRRDQPIKEGRREPFQYRSKSGDVRYGWNDSSKGSHGLYLILIVPPKYTLVHSRPPATEAWTHAGRLAVVWRPEEGGAQNVRFSWGLAPLTSDLEGAKQQLNSDFLTTTEETPASSSVTISVHGGTLNLGQVNTGQVRGNIVTHLNVVTGASASEFVEAVKTLVEVVQKDQKLGEPERAEILEDLDYLAEEASRPPEERRPTLLRQAIEHIPEALSAAESAKAAWDTFGPVITGFFGH